ncbi:MAG: TIGR04086 family membrane protein [Oscillospiraceae bacterium]|jgi:putative membrane protein (TIGR04086 family)|nr:TIGR04086 family membrane protein [Oscillospiraceae bacterium]
MSALTKISKFSKSKRRSGAITYHPGVSLLLGTGISLALSFVLTGVCAQLTAVGVIPETGMGLAVLALSFLSSLPGGAAAAKKSAVRKLPIALGSAALYYIFVFAMGRAASGEAAPAGLILGVLPCCIGGAGLGGYWTLRTKKPRR